MGMGISDRQSLTSTPPHQTKSSGSSTIVAKNSSSGKELGSILKEVHIRIKSAPSICGRMLEEGLVYHENVMKSKT